MDLGLSVFMVIFCIFFLFAVLFTFACFAIIIVGIIRKLKGANDNTDSSNRQVRDMHLHAHHTGVAEHQRMVDQNQRTIDMQNLNNNTIFNNNSMNNFH